MIENEDRRVRKTRKLIQDALFSLMQEYPYHKLRISQITERADISRSTFYLHYQTKEDLLLSIVDEIIDQYFKAIDQMDNRSKVSPSHLLFLNWKQNIEKMKLILDAGMEYRSYHPLRTFNQQRGYHPHSRNNLLDDYIRTLLDGAAFALLIRWTQDNASIPVNQMEQLFNGMNIDFMFESLGEKMPDFGKS